MFKISFDFRMSFRKKDSEPLTETSTVRLSNFTNREALLMGQSRSISTLNNYRTAVASVIRFAGDNVTLADITADMTEAYQAWLRSHGICLNTVSCYMRSLRTIYNRAVEAGIVADARPFRRVFTGKTPTDKRSADIADIRSLLSLKLTPGTPLELARDMFVFSFYAMGMPFIDLAFLRKSQITRSHILYYRHKTGQRICVAIEPCMADIILRHSDTANEYVFPILRSVSTENALREYATRLSTYNRALKRLAAMAGIKLTLTSYVARHTWASAAFRSDVDLKVISKAMGHTNPRTTMVYIRELDDNSTEQANRMVIESVISTGRTPVQGR